MSHPAHRGLATLAIACALAACSATTGSSTPSGTAGSTTAAIAPATTPPRTVDPARRQTTLEQALDTFGLTAEQKRCTLAALDPAPASEANTPRDLITHALDCGAQPTIAAHLAATAATTQHLDPQQQACLENELTHTDRAQLIDALSGTQDAITHIEQAARTACAITTPT